MKKGRCSLLLVKEASEKKSISKGDTCPAQKHFGTQIEQDSPTLHLEKAENADQFDSSIPLRPFRKTLLLSERWPPSPCLPEPQAAIFSSRYS
jgi:hypothetical protein